MNTIDTTRSPQEIIQAAREERFENREDIRQVTRLVARYMLEDFMRQVDAARERRSESSQPLRISVDYTFFSYRKPSYWKTPKSIQEVHRVFRRAVLETHFRELTPLQRKAEMYGFEASRCRQYTHIALIDFTRIALGQVLHRVEGARITMKRKTLLDGREVGITLSAVIDEWGAREGSLGARSGTQSSAVAALPVYQKRFASVHF